MGLPQIITGAQNAKAKLLADGHALEADSVQRLIVSRASSAALNKVLHTDRARLCALLRRAHKAIASDEKDGAVWAQLLADMKAEIENG